MDWKDLKEIRKNTFDKQDFKISLLQDIEKKIDEKSENIKDTITLVQFLKVLFSEDNTTFFISEDSKYIFFLTQIEGTSQREALKITRKLYSNADEAKKWRNDILQYIHPDRSNHPLAKQACQKLEELYGDMTRG